MLPAKDPKDIYLSEEISILYMVRFQTVCRRICIFSIAERRYKSCIEYGAKLEMEDITVKKKKKDKSLLNILGNI